MTAYALILHGFMFAVFEDWKPSPKVCAHSLELALVQWQNMAIHEYKNTRIANRQNPQNIRTPLKNLCV
jgi:hypothetical protein